MSQDDESFTDEDIRELIKDALKQGYENKKAFNKELKINSALASTLKEFLGNFIVIGYDLNDNPLIIKYAKTQMEKDALTSLAIKYISRLIYENDK
jgi:3-deoxy-D-manno-octulosonate 8-phosphate phosphatase KdsC-like HAD superfamily phosphatase